MIARNTPKTCRLSFDLKTTYQAITVFLLVSLLSPSVFAEDKDDKKPKIPDPEHMTLTTKDGVLLRCTYYAGTKGKNTVPIILLHDWDGRRSDMSSLADELQFKGHAVIVPDLRGHGASLNVKGSIKKIDRERIKPGMLLNGMKRDIEAVKKFLMKENRAGKLNIELLCLVGSGMSCPVALNWIQSDWSWPQLPTIKQGQDVKAVVLLSPPRSFEGYNAVGALKHPYFRGKYPDKSLQLSTMIIVGKRVSKANSEAKTIYSSMKRYYPDLDEKPKAVRLKETALYFFPIDTKFQGTKLIDPRLKKGVEAKIVKFIELRLVDRADQFNWTKR